jgi:gamma-glutamyl:cysteine ligase YbdK (ATP-grasp superfamily)
MGEAIRQAGVVADGAVMRERLDRSITALERMIDDGAFDTQAETCGLEVELDLVDPLGRPRHVNAAVLAALDRHDVQAELSRFNIEFNVPARPTHGPLLRRLDDELSATLDAVTAVAQQWGARAVAVGTLPSLHATDLTSSTLSGNPRYPYLDAAMAASRERSVRLDIRGRQHLEVETDSIAVQAAATSLQVHVRVAPDDFARFYNAAQAVSPALVAAAANSPYLLGRRLWHETRIPLIEQSLDTRRAGAAADGEPPRVWMGDAWSATAVDVLADNVRRYPPLLPILEPPDPLQELADGRVPALLELRRHSGSIWRWNRPVYDVQHDHPHLRIENRVMPSGPTATDMVANAALFLGLVRAVADLDPPISRLLDFRQVPDDLHEAARHGPGGQLHWPGPAGVAARCARRLLLETLLPLASTGLAAWGVDQEDADRYLGVVQERVSTGRTGARWQTRTVEQLEERGADREWALREMVRRYVEHAGTHEPVHRWPSVAG